MTTIRPTTSRRGRRDQPGSAKWGWGREVGRATGTLAALLVLLAAVYACGSSAPSPGSGPDSDSAVADRAQGTTREDAEAPPDPAVDGGSGERPGDAAPDALATPSYPACAGMATDGGLYRFYQCTATGTCVSDCSACAGAPTVCLPGGNKTPIPEPGTKCVADCTLCPAQLGHIQNVCANACTDELNDSYHCGSCGHACNPLGPAPTKQCTSGHCCPLSTGAGIYTWQPACSRCCTGGCGGPDCVPEG